MRNAKTFFEQVPLEVVKRIATQQTNDTSANSNGLAIVESSVSGTASHNDDQDFQYPQWQKLCQEALTEFDRDKLRNRVAAAEAAVVMRLQELANKADAQAERQALLDVASSLRFLKRDILMFPDWESTP